MQRPAARNALGKTMMLQLNEAIANIKNCTTSRCVILQSTVPKVFCAGADLKERALMSQQEGGMFVEGLRTSFTAIENLPIPVIAAIEGAALGGGLEIALAADIRVSGSKAIYGQPETSLAIIPGAGGTQRLPRLIGASKAKELIFTARRIDANRAKELGIVDHVVAENCAYAKCEESK
jgi:methylglutaconyl-CoA hydratase